MFPSESTKVGCSLAAFLCRALRVRKKMSGEKMPVKMIGDILTAQLPHMQPYIRFCSCQLNGAALIQQKTDEAPDFKEFVKVRSPGSAKPLPHKGPSAGNQCAIARAPKANRGEVSAAQEEGLALTSGCGWGHGGGLGEGPALTWKLQSAVQMQVVFLQYRFKILRLIFRPRRTGRSQVCYSV